MNFYDYAFDDSPYSDGTWADQIAFDLQNIDAVSGEALGLDFFPVPVETYPSYYEDRRRTAQCVSA